MQGRPRATPVAAAVTHFRAAAPADKTALGAVAGITLLAFVLRLPGMRQTIFGDESFTHTIVTTNGLGGVWHEVYETSITPPLHYVVAWLTLKVGGDSTVVVRIPSLVLGTATVPLVYLLGRKVEGNRAGLIAAVALALGPFPIWYSDEARAYALLMFLLALSVLALMKAVDGDGRRWWVIYALTSCAALWTHYTSFFVVGVGAAWALWMWRDRWRTPAIAVVAIAVLYLPWLPGFVNQRKNKLGIETIDLAAHGLTPAAPFKNPLQTLFGSPSVGLATLPGGFGALMALVVVALLVPLMWRHGAELRRVVSGSSRTALIVGLTIATPVGLLFYAAGGTSLFIPRNFSASLPALVVLAGIVIARLTLLVPRTVGYAALAALAALSVGVAVKNGGDEYRRPPYAQAARWVDPRAGARDVVVEATPGSPIDRRLKATSLGLYMKRPHTILRAGISGPTPWRRLVAGRQVFVIGPSSFVSTDLLQSRIDATPGAAPPGMVARARLAGGENGLARRRESKRFGGTVTVQTDRFSGVVKGRLAGPRGRERIAWTFGRDVPVRKGVANGTVSEMTPPGTTFKISGWAVRARIHTAADWVLLFSGRRLFAVAALGVDRPDVQRFLGPAAALSGFTSTAQPAPRGRRQIRAFAIVGDRASALSFTGQARRARR